MQKEISDYYLDHPAVEQAAEIGGKKVDSVFASMLRGMADCVEKGENFTPEWDGPLIERIISDGVAELLLSQWASGVQISVDTDRSVHIVIGDFIATLSREVMREICSYTPPSEDSLQTDQDLDRFFAESKWHSPVEWSPGDCEHDTVWPITGGAA